VKGKRNGTHPAKDLYISPLFRKRRAYAERTGSAWFILSAKYGLLNPNEPVPSYDVTLKSMSAAQRREWSAWVVRQIVETGMDLANTTVEIHAGKDYRDFGLTTRLCDAGCKVMVPLAHLGIGSQLARYNES